MSARLRQRLLQGLALLAVAAAGIWAWHRVVRPDPAVLVRLADEKLKSIFGEGVEYERVEIDLVTGVRLSGLKVHTPSTPLPTLEAEHVEIRHDLLALASGLYRPETIEIRGARIVTRETEEGIALDFPFHLDASDTDGALPRILLTGSKLLYRALPDSKRLRGGTVLVVDDIDLDVSPRPDGLFGIDGSFETRGLGQDEVRIQVEGTADAEADELLLGASWSPFRISPFLLDVLAEEVAARLRGQEGEFGDLVVSLARRPDHAEGEVQVFVRWRGQIRMALEDLPGSEYLDAGSLEQLEALLRRADLDLQVTPEGVNLGALVDALGGGEIQVDGRIRDDGETLRLRIEVTGLRLDDPALIEALGEEERAILASFDPQGRVDADILVTKRPGRGLHWEIEAILLGNAFRYVGTPAEDGSPEGFPYLVERATGRVHVEDERIWFDDIVGFNRRQALVRIRSPWEEAWTGGETGRIRITEEGPDIRLTVEATTVPVDAELYKGIDGSEFREMREEFELAGVVDLVEIDITAIPGRDEVAYAEVRLTFADEQFRYLPFPLQIDKVDGWLTFRRPFLDRTTRGRVFRFDVRGVADGAKVHVWAEHDDIANEGRLHVTGEGVSLAGALTDTVLSAEATEGGLADVWRFLQPRGRADVDADLPLGDHPDPLRLTASVRRASIRLDAEGARRPVEVTDLEGMLEVVDDRVALRDMRGRIQDTRIRIDGWIEGGPEGRWDLHVTTDVLRTTPELLASLEDLAGGEPFLPEGLELGTGARLVLDLRLRRAEGEEAEIEAAVVATDVDATVGLPGGMALDVRGARLRVEDETVEIEDLTGEAPGLRIRIERAQVLPDGLVGRATLHLEEYEPTDEILALLPEEARDLLAEWAEDRVFDCDALTIDVRADGSMRFDGDLSLLAHEGAGPGGAPRGDLEVHGLELSAEDAGGARTLRGHAHLGGFRFGEDVPLEAVDAVVEIARLRLGDDPEGRGTVRIEKAKLFDLSAEDLVVPFTWRQGILRAEPIAGRLVEGALRGRLLLHTKDPLAYEGEAHLEGFRLETLKNDLAPTGPPLAGRGTAHVTFQNRSGETRDLTAEGRLSVREGNLGDLPVVANVFAFFGTLLDVPDPPRFERADAVFTLRDEVVVLSRFDLAGPLFDMPGRGTVDLGGFVDLVFTPDIIKSFLLPGVMQFPVVGDVLDALLREDVLYALRLRGDVSTAEPEIIALPPLGLEGDRPFEGTGTPQLPARRIPRWFR